METVKLSPQDIQYWDEWRQELTQVQRTKSEKFVNLDLIKYIGENKFICEPISGYNVTTHQITKDPQWTWRCSCQGFVTKEREHNTGELLVRPFCSHIHALLMSFRLKKFNRWSGEGELGKFMK